MTPWVFAVVLLLLSGCVGIEEPEPEPVVAPAPTGDLIGKVETYVARADDTLIELARQNDLGYLELAAANPGIDPWLPKAGAEILLPKARLLPAAPRRGIVVNLPEQRLYYFRKGQPPETFAIGIGRDGFETPIGVAKVTKKQRNPIWFPTRSARAEDPSLPRAVPPGPDNPLGKHALYLTWPTLLIHGTNKPYAIGRRASRGCLRLYPEDMERLFSLAAVGAEVRIINQPIKVGWWKGELYLEANPTLKQAAQMEDRGTFDPAPAPEANKLVVKAAGPAAKHIDWAVVDKALRERRGVPVAITRLGTAPPAAAFASASSPASHGLPRTK